MEKVIKLAYTESPETQPLNLNQNLNQRRDQDSEKPPAAQEVTILGLSHEGRGIASVENKTTFVENALPSEKVLIHYKKRHKKFDEAQALSILTPSPHRQTPACAHFNICGGCTLQHLSSPGQVAFKEKTLLEQLWHFGRVKPEEVLSAIQGPPLGYRRKARLGVKWVEKKGKVLVGFREKGSHKIAELKACEILDPRIGQSLEALQALIGQLSAKASIPQIEVACGDNLAALVFRHVDPLSDSDQQKIIAFATTHQLQVYLQPGNLSSIHLIYSPAHSTDPTTVPKASTLHYTLPEFGLKLQFEATDFVQINGSINQLMVSAAIEALALQSTDTVLDLFCGLGNFTLAIAKFANLSVGVEGGDTMVKRATQNAQNNHISNARFFCEDLNQPQFPSAWSEIRYNKALIDPPRTGAAAIMPHLKKLGIQHLVYISCNPATLARDLGELVHQQGFHLKSVRILDMFPHTSHVESMAVLGPVDNSLG